MGKTTDTKAQLPNLSTKFSLSPGGRTIDLEKGLVIELRNELSAGVWRDAKSGDAFTLSGGSSVTGISPAGVIDGTMNAILLKGKATLSTQAANYLSYTRKFTVSFWMRSPATYPNDSSPIDNHFLMSSGSYGATFCAIAAMGKIVHLLTGSVSGVGSPSTFFLRAGSTARNQGDTWYDQSNAAGAGVFYRFRKSQELNAGISSENLWSPETWNMVTIVNRPARQKHPTATEFMAQTSTIGDEGRLETWVNGMLVNSNPPMEGLPRAWAPLFEEDHEVAITSPTSQYAWFNGVGYGIFSQNDCNLKLQGEPVNGTEFFQVGVWSRDLSPVEITSLYQGTKRGVYLGNSTSWSVTARSRLYSDQKDPLLDRNNFLGDGGGSTISPFSDSTASPFYNSTEGNTVEGNFSIDLSSGLESLESWRTRDSFEGSIDLFKDESDPSKSVYDPEFDTPNGSSIVRIPVPNIGSYETGGFAGRYFQHFVGTFPSPVDDFQSIAIGNEDVTPPVGSAANRNCRGSGFLYYSPSRKAWIEKRYDSSTSKLREPDSTSAYYQVNNVIKKDPNLISSTGLSPYGTKLYSSTSGQDGSNSIMAQFSWSPQMGYYLPFEEHRNQIGYQKIGWPTSLFNAPNAPRYHGFQDETIKMSSYINAPFLVKKIILDIPIKSFRRFGNYTDFPSVLGRNYSSPPPGANISPAYAQYVTNKKDMDNYVFFLYRQTRTAKVKDSVEDRMTSKRYIFASASLCFYNSQAFGKADSTEDNRPIREPALASTIVAIPNSATEDRAGRPLTFSTNPTHTPAFSYDWNVGRNVTVNKMIKQRLSLEMLPAVCPRQFVSPSLMPFSASRDDVSTLGSPQFSQFRHQSGSFLDPAGVYGSLYTTLISNFWFGGTTNPAYFNTNLYDTAGLFGSEATPLEGVDVATSIGPALLFAVANESSAPSLTSFDAISYTTGALNKTFWRSTFTVPVTRDGATNVALSDFTKLRGSSYGPVSENYQIPIDPRSVNVPTVAAGAAPIQRGILDIFTGDVEKDQYYALEYGVLVAGAPQVSDIANQVYSPYILLPDDELILGLDAGTFGPPDQAPNGSFTTSSLKDAYRLAMADSWMQVLQGDAQITLIGEYLRDNKPVLSTKNPFSTNGIETPIGMYQITDEYRSRTIQELSGTVFDRIMQGSPGLDGIVDGSRKVASLLSTRRDLGITKSSNYFFKIVDDSRNWFDESVFGYNNNDSSWSPQAGTSLPVRSPPNGNDSFIFSPNHYGFASDMYGASPNRIYIRGPSVDAGIGYPPVSIRYASPAGTNLVVNPPNEYFGPLNTTSTDFFSVKYSSGSWAGAERNREDTATSRFIDRPDEDSLVED